MNIVAQELKKVAQELVSMDFSTKSQYDKYMKDHPDADKSKHHVVENKNSPIQDTSKKFSIVQSLAKEFGMTVKPGRDKSEKELHAVGTTRDLLEKAKKIQGKLKKSGFKDLSNNENGIGLWDDKHGRFANFALDDSNPLKAKLVVNVVFDLG
jgi:hypothetical protein